MQAGIDPASAAPRPARSNRVAALWILTAGALILAGFVGANLLQTLATYRWEKTSCTVLSSRIIDYRDDSRRAYTLEIRYEYRVGGQTFQSTSYNDTHGFMGAPQNWNDYSEADRELQRYPAGSHSVCFVHPSDPKRAALVRGGIWVHLLMLGLTFMLWLMLRFFYVPGKPPTTSAVPSSRCNPKANPRLKEARQSAFVALMTLPMGLFIGWWSIAKPLTDARNARGWVETPCTVLSSEMRSTQTRFGPNYSPNILFAYEFNGREYRANKFQFSDDSETKAAGVQRTLAKYPASHKTVCFVNPADPAAAVLDRGFKLSLSLTVLVPVFMVLSGTVFLGIALALRMGMAVPAWLLGHAHLEPAAPLPKQDKAPAGPVTLRAKTASPARMLASAAGIVICFGFVGYMVWDTFRDWRQTGEFEFSIINLVYTGLAGVFGLAALTEWWKFFSPQPALQLNRAAIALGSEWDLAWTISGNVARLRDVTFSLEGREEVIRNEEEMTAVGRQQKMVTVKSIFHNQPLAAPMEAEALRSGTMRVRLPTGVMPTFDGHRNKIIWSVAVRGNVRYGSKMDHEFRLRVLPMEA